MTTQEALQAAEKLLQPITTEFARPAPDRLDAAVSTDRLLAAVTALRDARWGYLAVVTGLDRPAVAAKGDVPATPGQVEILYHFCEGGAVATLRVKVPYDAARVPSVCGLVPAATLYERELGEMFGVTVEGTPVTDHLLLPDSWPQGVYPLRKSFSGLPKANS